MITSKHAPRRARRWSAKYLPIFASPLLCFLAALALAKPDCDSNSDHPSCQNDGGEDGQYILMNCELFSDYRTVENFLDDTLGIYFHDVDNVVCRTGATGKVNLSGIVFSAFPGKVKGKQPPPPSRLMDLHLDPAGIDDPSLLPGAIFEPGKVDESDPVFGNMSHLRVAVRPYKDGQTDIQLLEPDTVHQMALRINDRNNRWKLNLASRVVENDNLQGVLCGDRPEAVANTTDVNVWVWPDDNADGVPDGYTVTTGTFDSLVNPDPELFEPGAKTAVLCSNQLAQDDRSCRHHSDGWCNIRGEVEIQFTLHARTQ